MASPISFTIDERRCWTTERVIGSILADIFALLARGEVEEPADQNRNSLLYPEVPGSQTAASARVICSLDQQVVIDMNPRRSE